MRTTNLCTVTTAMVVAASIASAQPQPQTASGAASRSDEHMAKRERAFWVCDYVATTRGVQYTPVDYCSQATEDLKNEKFGGDYDQMVLWWRDRRRPEHSKLEKEAKP